MNRAELDENFPVIAAQLNAIRATGRWEQFVRVAVFSSVPLAEVMGTSPGPVLHVRDGDRIEPIETTVLTDGSHRYVLSQIDIERALAEGYNKIILSQLDPIESAPTDDPLSTPWTRLPPTGVRFDT